MIYIVSILSGATQSEKRVIYLYFNSLMTYFKLHIHDIVY